MKIKNNTSITLFGTDGIRGKANQWPITPDCLYKVGLSAGTKFSRKGPRNMVVIGRDTRSSGSMIEAALTAGFLSAGMDVALLGVLPTPAIGTLTRSLRAHLGIMISASHNIYSDNGIKLFAADGLKSSIIEAAIEKMVASEDFVFVSPGEIGKVYPVETASGRYIEFVKSTLPKSFSLANLKIVIDCANGAAYKVGPSILWELGAEVISLGINPNGVNINDSCGAMSLDAIRQAVVEHKADIGIALDGDADRLIIINEYGGIVDGDQIIALLASSWIEEDQLKGDGVITTYMSNTGLKDYLTTKSLKLIHTDVGDHHIVQAMRDYGYNLGGEQCGHIILTDYGFTGDGLLTALQVLKIMVKKEQAASQLCRVFEPVPQVLKNIAVNDADQVLGDSAVIKVLQEAEKCLSAEGGRLLVRKSGTEAVIRIMAEGKDPQSLQSLVQNICDVLS